ncbi:MAG TPA: MoaD/ThiS family protein [Thermoclostridium caenicola]|uniref:MoaD/ThiS family protein n=1 Tax=Thermoclostridium caenicola TaxID=659425 RepID=UPI002B89A2C3|nr:MoaD/ThiS family protein [Thermoclostridium caenicola]HPO76112.1 MoaD/ThiS family protein [Thermoclostridium caenicola]
MKLKIVFKASLKRYSNSSDGIDNISIDGPATIQDIIDLYGISPLDVGITIINGKMVPRSTFLKDNDVVELFTMLKGG